MRSLVPSLSFVVMLACNPAEGGEAPAERQAEVQALQAATEELAAARVALEADRTAMKEQLTALREAVDAANAKLELLAVSRPQPQPAPLDESLDLALPADPPLPRVVEDPAALAAAVRCETEARCTVERSYFETLLINPGGFAKQARLVPKHGEDGSMQGYKLYGIRTGSFFKALGVKNGDLVRSINGHALASMEQTLELYTKLRHEKTFTLAIERRGAPFTLTIEIVGA